MNQKLKILDLFSGIGGGVCLETRRKSENKFKAGAVMENLVAVINAGWTPPVDLSLPKYRGIGWYKAVRMEYIGFVLEGRGVIYPQDLVDRFRISIPQARADIEQWREINKTMPLIMQPRKKSYERHRYEVKKNDVKTAMM